MENPQVFIDHFLDSDSDLFMNTNINQIYKQAKRSAILQPASYQDISDLQSQIESLSRLKEQRELRGQKRKISTRIWTTHSERHCLISDLAFIRNLNVDNKTNNKTYRILYLIQDAYSRLIYLAFIPNKSTEQTKKQFDKAIDFFTANGQYENSYKLFCSDRGGKSYAQSLNAISLTPPISSQVQLQNFKSQLGEFGHDFKSYIKQKYGIKSYSCKLGLHAKVAIAERGQKKKTNTQTHTKYFVFCY